MCFFFLCVCYPYKIGGKNRIFFEEGGNFLLWFDFCRYFSLFPVRLLHKKSPYPAPAACCCALKCCLLNFLEMSFLRLKESRCRWAVGGDGDHPASGQFATIPKGRKNKKKNERVVKVFPKVHFGWKWNLCCGGRWRPQWQFVVKVSYKLERTFFEVAGRCFSS